MRDDLLTLAFLFCALCGNAQTLPYFSNFLPVAQSPCPFNPAVQIDKPLDWLIYQTRDGLWDGVIDSTRCISAKINQSANGIKIALDEIDPSEPLFLRFLTDLISDYPMDSNQIFLASVCFDQYPDTLLMSTGTNCDEGVCTGLFIGIAIPDSLWLPNEAMRYQMALAKKDSWFCTISACFPSENFEEQHLRQLVLKFTFPSGIDLTGKYLNLYNITVEPAFPWDGPHMVYQVEASPSHLSGGAYYVPIYEASPQGFSGNYLMRYNAPTYPSPQHQSYVEATPNPNSSTPQIINLVVQQYENLEIHPFTNFRGGLVSGSDSVRHTANLVNMGADFCLNFVDLIFTGGDEYRHGGGNISMNHPRSCMQFRDGSKLRVLENATLHYGNNGAGMLVVCADAGIVLERGATLVIDGTMSLSECSDNPQPQEITVNLPPGATLRFTENAVLTNQFSQFQQTTLRVRMLGGVLDDSALSAAERALIRREYPTPSPVFADNIEIYPNPFRDRPVINYLAGENETVRLQWFDLNGRTLKTETFYAIKGANEWHPVGPQQDGVYLLVVESSSGKVMKKVVRG